MLLHFLCKQQTYLKRTYLQDIFLNLSLREHLRNRSKTPAEAEPRRLN